MLAPVKLWNIFILFAAEDLFTVVAGIQPRGRSFWRANKYGSFAERLGQIYRIRYHREIRDAIAVADKVLPNRGLIALDNAIGADPTTLNVCCLHGEHVAFVLTRGKP